MDVLHLCTTIKNSFGVFRKETSRQFYEDNKKNIDQLELDIFFNLSLFFSFGDTVLTAEEKKLRGE